ncbi:alpha/beta hydrolase fold-domain-containing protein [Paraphoma chrysanthemicola]|nr:alpha/beta hydrolase fold-domain-containing protein [Paraphoma chrysanthemicola]
MAESLEMARYNIKESSSIRVTDRHDRSQLMAVVQFLVRRFRNQINSGNPKHDDGSLKLDPPNSKLRNCTVSERTVCDIHIYDIRIYYFAGGSWQMKPSGQHWSLCAKMATELPDTIVSMVSMPIAPNNPAPSSFPWCLKLYRTLMAEAQEAGDKVILAGDSSGANVVFCLTLEALREDAENALGVTAKQTSNPHPVALMGISPSTDLTRNNPDIDKIAKHDPLLTPDVIKQTAKAWHADWDPADRKVSPINAELSLLAKRGIKVHGITAGSDILAPDGVIFRNRCAENNVEGEWLHWEKQMHCFVLTLPYGLREANEGVQWVIDVLRKE